MGVGRHGRLYSRHRIDLGRFKFVLSISKWGKLCLEVWKEEVR